MDIQKVMDAITADAEREDIIVSANAEIALRVQRALDNPDTTIDQLGKLIAAEPILTARVVSIANSVAYNPGGMVTTNIRSAITRIGFKAMRVLVSAVVVRQMQNLSKTPEHRAMAAQLWEHTVHVAALARIIAQRITKQDPEAAFFAGIVHEVGGFYLISRAVKYPGLFDGPIDQWHGDGEARVGRAVMKVLSVPDNIEEAVETLWNGYLALPPFTLGDTLLLADQLCPIESPLNKLASMDHAGVTADIDLSIGTESLSSILKDSAAEVESLVAALKA